MVATESAREAAAAEAEELIPRAQETKVSLRMYIITVAFFILSLLGLGLGLGLRPSRITASESILDIPEDDRDWQDVPLKTLINSAELELDTKFEVSDRPTVRKYTFDITQGYAAPDGLRKAMILVNNQSPGPLIEANIGDTIRVQVNNQMSNTSTSIHWHGIDQKNTTIMDGVTGVTQCAIPPGSSFTYEFTVTGQRGTYWYHSHTTVQYTDGLYGPVVIHDPDEKIAKADDEKIVFIGDYYHGYAGALVESYLRPGSQWAPDSPGVEPLADNLLMNGQNEYNCSHDDDSKTWVESNSAICAGGQLYRTKVLGQKSTRLRLINHSSFMSLWFSIDNHTLSIVEIDGVEVEPISSRGVYVNVGQRYSVIVHTDQAPGNYYMRATLPQTCFLPYTTYTNPALESGGYQVRGVLSYPDIDINAEPIGIEGNVTNPYGVYNNLLRGDVWEGCLDMPFDMPKPVRKERALDVVAANQHSIQFEFEQAGEINRIFVNRTSWVPLDQTTQLWQAMDQEFTPGHAGSYSNWKYKIDQQVLLIPEANQGVQVVINSLDNMEHPWHLHGHSFQVVGWGDGLYGDNKTTWNLENPMRRDTVTVPAYSHIVIRFLADNPGIWALHCHVAWHMEAGMFVSFIERPDDLKAIIHSTDPEVVSTARGFCKQPRVEGPVRRWTGRMSTAG